MTDTKGLSEEDILLLRNSIAVLSGTYKINATIPSLEGQLINGSLKLINDYTALAERLKACEAERDNWVKKAYLCAHEVAFFSMWNGKDYSGPPTLGIICNDTFAYATADCEAVLDGQLDKIIEMYKSDGEAGLIRWVSAQRDMRPMDSVGEWLSKYDSVKAERDQLTADLARVMDERDRLRAALSKAAHELNAIRARDGAPQHIDWDRGRPFQMNGCDPEYFSQLVDECQAALAKEQP